MPGRDTQPTVRQRADRFIHDARVEYTILALIVASVALMLYEVALPPSSGLRVGVEVLGHVITGVFAVELLIRYWVARKKSRFFRNYWLDIVAVVPIVRPLRFLRVLRLFRAGVLFNRRFSVFRAPIRGTALELTALAAGTVVVVLTGAMVLYRAEGGTEAFPDFESTLWFSVLSLVAGEPIGADPQTEIGRFTELSLMIGGLTLFGMFVGTISASMVSRLSKRLELQEMDLDELTRHVVVFGWNRSAHTVVRELFGPGTPAGRAVVVVTETEDPPEDLHQESIPEELLYHHVGDWTRVEVLHEVGIPEAAVAVILTDGQSPRSDQDKDARTVLSALNIERLNPEIYTIAEVTSLQNEPMLRNAGVEQIVVGDWYAGVIMGSASRNPGLIAVLDEVLTTKHGNAFYTLRVPVDMKGRTVAELHRALVEQDAILVALQEPGEPLEVNPAARQTVSGDARVTVLAKGKVQGWPHA